MENRDLLQLVKLKLISFLEKTPKERYLAIGDKIYSKQDLANEIKNNTDIGINTLGNVLNATLELLSKKKTK